MKPASGLRVLTQKRSCRPAFGAGTQAPLAARAHAHICDRLRAGTRFGSSPRANSSYCRASGVATGERRDSGAGCCGIFETCSESLWKPVCPTPPAAGSKPGRSTPLREQGHAAATLKGSCARLPSTRTRPLASLSLSPLSARRGHRLALLRTFTASPRKHGITTHSQGAPCTRTMRCTICAHRMWLTKLAPLQELKDLQNDPPTQCSAGACLILCTALRCVILRGPRVLRAPSDTGVSLASGASALASAPLRRQLRVQDPCRRTTCFTGRRRSWGAALLAARSSLVTPALTFVV